MEIEDKPTENNQSTNYKNIAKSTFLFSFVKIFQILIAILKNKIVAILLGAEGMGIIGIFQNSINLLQTGAGLGINQSAVRDVSEANGCNDHGRFSRIISLTNKVILFTCLLGCTLTLFLSPLLSEWTFGNKNYTISYIWLALVVGLTILSNGQLAILTGMRQLRALAKASMIGSVVGLVTSVPLYFFFGKSGIVPSLIITAVSALLFSSYYVRQIKYDRVKLTLKEIYREANPMVKMGVALMFVSFAGALFNLIILSYIRSQGGLEEVGFYSAGVIIIANYFGVVLTAMTTDYYPRISAVHEDNTKLQEEMNRQSEVGLILIFPLSVLFVFLSPIIIQILYSKEFIQTIYYTDIAILGTIIILCADCMGMILLAKQASNIFIYYVLGLRVLLIIIYIVLYNLYGLLGLGISYLVMGIAHITLISFVMGHKYKIKFNKSVYEKLLVVFIATVAAILFRKIDNMFFSYLLGAALFLFSCSYSYLFMKKNMNIDFNYLISKFK